jgi:hypothetical protein
MMAVNQLLRLHHGHVVIRAIERNRFLKLTIRADDIRAVVRHVAAPFDQAGAQNSLSPRCRGLGGDMPYMVSGLAQNRPLRTLFLFRLNGNGGFTALFVAVSPTTQIHPALSAERTFVGNALVAEFDQKSASAPFRLSFLMRGRSPEAELD